MPDRNRQGLLRRLALFLLAVTMCCLPVTALELQILGPSTTWKIFSSLGQGTPATGWKKVQFDDSAWASVRAGLVLPEDEVVGLRPSRKGTVFLRQKFSISNPREIRSLHLALEHDGSCAIFLNGTEVYRVKGKGFRIRLPDTKGDPEASVFPKRADLSPYLPLLQPGENVMAIEAENSGETESDAPVSASLTANFPRGPFVQNMTTQSVQVIWRTAEPATTQLEYGTSAGLGTVWSDAQPTTNHVVSLQDLKPSTQYFYRAGSQSGETETWSDIYSFTTFKNSGDVEFFICGDTGGGNSLQVALGEVMKKSPVDFVIHAGDITYGGFRDDTAQTRVFNMYGQQMRSVPFFFTVGNHDLDGENSHFPDATRYENVFYHPTNSATGSELFYSVDQGDLHFVSLFNPYFGAYVLNSNTVQFQWLTNDLARSTRPWKLLFFHSPVASSGAYRNADFDQNGKADEAEMMDLLLPVCEQYGVQLIVGGHDHSFERFAPTNGVHHLVCAGGGGYWYDVSARHAASAQHFSDPHVLKAKIQKDLMTIRAYDTNGVEFDSFLITRKPMLHPVYESTFHSPVVEGSGSTYNDRGNIEGQAFDLRGTPIPCSTGRFSNLGFLYVNNDDSTLYVGLKNPMFYANDNLFLFIESPSRPGVSSMAGLGNGIRDPLLQGADGLDFLENLSFNSFRPCVGCILGDERADGQYRSFARTNIDLNIGQGVFYLNSSLDDVPGIRLQQYNRSPEVEPIDGESNADFIEIAIPFASLGGVQPGQVIKIAAVAAGPEFSMLDQRRFLDTSFIGTSMTGSGMNPVQLGAVSVRLTVPRLKLTADQSEITITWPRAAGAYGLEKAIDLRKPISWQPVPGAMTGNEEYSITVPAKGSGFFRLKRE